jgi:D-alanyl-D-alanine carboxypeptidase
MAGIAADAPTLARWGYKLYGARLLPPQTVRAMTTQQAAGNVFPGIGYGLGTQLFSGLATDATVGHIGENPGYTSMLAVVPARHLSAAILIPEENRKVLVIMRNLLAAMRKSADTSGLRGRRESLVSAAKCSRNA